MRLTLFAITGMLLGSGYLMLPSAQELARRIVRDEPGQQLLDGATIGDEAIWAEALERGAAVDVRGRSGSTPLVCAADRGDVELARRLILAGADVGVATDDGVTPLSSAAMNGCEEIMRLLLQAGAQVDQPSFRGGTALHAAAAQAQLGAVRLLLARGADVNGRDREGNTPLIAFAYRGECDATLAEDLLLAGADPALADQDGNTAYTIADAEGHDALKRLLRASTSPERVTHVARRSLTQRP